MFKGLDIIFKIIIIVSSLKRQYFATIKYGQDDKKSCEKAILTRAIFCAYLEPQTRFF